jgi:hypothetical protein
LEARERWLRDPMRVMKFPSDSDESKFLKSEISALNAELRALYGGNT